MPERRSPVAAATAIRAEVQIDAPITPDNHAGQQAGLGDPYPGGPFASTAEMLHRFGLSLIPVSGEGDGKSPLINGFTRWKQRPSLAMLGKWSKRWPDANIGIVTGQKVIVVDIDDVRLIGEMIERFGPTPLHVTTPSGGLHLYYQSSGERSANLRPSLPVDIKSMGGYVVAPPSIRTSGEFAGRRYKVVTGSWADLPRLPPLRPGSLPTSAGEPENQPVPLRAIGKGRRNKTLFDRLLRHAAHCDHLDALVDVAQTIVADHFLGDPLDPFDAAEIEKTARSAWKYETEGRNWVGRAGLVQLPAEDIAAFIEHPNGADMALLYIRLRQANWQRQVFAVSPKAMASRGTIPGWGQSQQRYRGARADLLKLGVLGLVKIGGSKRGDPNLYSFAISRGRRGAGGGGV